MTVDEDDVVEGESIFTRLWEFLVTAWLIIGPPLLIFLLYYFRKFYKKHKHIYSFISFITLLYIIFHYVFIIFMFMFLGAF